MKEKQPLDQAHKTVATATNHATKTAKKSQSEDCILTRLSEFALSVVDFRRQDKGNYRHKLSDIIMLQIFARAVGCNARAEINRIRQA